MGLAIQLDHRFGSKWMLSKLHRLGYTESYSETQNYKYCFLNSRSGDDAPDTSGTIDTIVEETDDQINDEVAVDAALEDQSVMTASENEMSSNDQVVSMEVGETNNAVYAVCWRQYRFKHCLLFMETLLPLNGLDQSVLRHHLCQIHREQQLSPG